MLTVYCSENTVEVLDAWHKLAERLLSYNDGYLNTAEEIGQPLLSFLNGWKVSYGNGPTNYARK